MAPHEEAAGGVLEGLRVVEFAHVISGPMAGTLLADLGADVIHVESPGDGDSSRGIGPSKEGHNLWWKVLGRNKRAITLNLRTGRGREIAQELGQWADVVITNMRVDTLRTWGLDWETLHGLKPTLVYLSVTGDGLGTADENAPGFGKVGEARSGVVALTGFADGPPVHTGFSHADAVTGLMGAFAICAALHRRHEPDFAGELIDIALFEPLFRLVDWQVIVKDQLGHTPRRAGNQMAISPAVVINTYLTADQEWIVVTSATPRSVRNVLDLLALDHDVFMGPHARVDARDVIDAKLAAWIGERSTSDALVEMRNREVVAEKIFDMDDIMASELFAHREAIISVDDADLGPVRMAGVIPRMHQRPGRVWRTGASLGADNETVYADVLAMSPEQIVDLESRGII